MTLQVIINDTASYMARINIVILACINVVECVGL